MQGAALGPCSHQLPVAQGPVHGARDRIGLPDADRECRGCRHLSLDATEALDDIRRFDLFHRVEQLPPHPPRQDLRPGGLGFSGHPLSLLAPRPVRTEPPRCRARRVASGPVSGATPPPSGGSRQRPTPILAAGRGAPGNTGDERLHARAVTGAVGRHDCSVSPDFVRGFAGRASDECGDEMGPRGESASWAPSRPSG